MPLSDFVEIDRVGEGAYSSVYKVKRLADSKIYALKKVKIPKLTQKEKDNALNEVRLLASIKHPNIIAFKEAFIDEATQTLCIITEYADGGDVYSKIIQHQKSSKFVKENDIWRVLIGATRGLRALHEVGIFHRDIKSANVFLTSAGEVKLGDLNVSKIAKQGLLETQTGTPYYASPEVWRDMPYDSKSDIWGLGCVVYEMAKLKPPFRASDMSALFRKVTEEKFERIPPHYSRDLSSVIEWLLEKNPLHRPSAKLLDESIVPRQQKPAGTNEGVESVESNQSKPFEVGEALLLKTIRYSNQLGEISSQLPLANYADFSLKELQEMQNRKGSNAWGLSKDKIKISLSTDSSTDDDNFRKEKTSPPSHALLVPLRPLPSPRVNRSPQNVPPLIDNKLASVQEEEEEQGVESHRESNGSCSSLALPPPKKSAPSLGVNSSAVSPVSSEGENARRHVNLTRSEGKEEEEKGKNGVEKRDLEKNQAHYDSDDQFESEHEEDEEKTNPLNSSHHPTPSAPHSPTCETSPPLPSLPPLVSPSASPPRKQLSRLLHNSPSPLIDLSSLPSILSPPQSLLSAVNKKIQHQVQQQSQHQASSRSRRNLHLAKGADSSSTDPLTSNRDAPPQPPQGERRRRSSSLSPANLLASPLFSEAVSPQLLSQFEHQREKAVVGPYESEKLPPRRKQPALKSLHEGQQFSSPLVQVYHQKRLLLQQQQNGMNLLPETFQVQGHSPSHLLNEALNNNNNNYNNNLGMVNNYINNNNNLHSVNNLNPIYIGNNSNNNNNNNNNSLTNNNILYHNNSIKSLDVASPVSKRSPPPPQPASRMNQINSPQQIQSQQVQPHAFVLPSPSRLSPLSPPSLDAGIGIQKGLKMRNKPQNVATSASAANNKSLISDLDVILANFKHNPRNEEVGGLIGGASLKSKPQRK